jgi:hypothetical protein
MAPSHAHGPVSLNLMVKWAPKDQRQNWSCRTFGCDGASMDWGLWSHFGVAMELGGLNNILRSKKDRLMKAQVGLWQEIVTVGSHDLGHKETIRRMARERRSARWLRHGTMKKTREYQDHYYSACSLNLHLQIVGCEDKTSSIFQLFGDWEPNSNRRISAYWFTWDDCRASTQVPHLSVLISHCVKRHLITGSNNPAAIAYPSFPGSGGYSKILPALFNISGRQTTLVSNISSRTPAESRTYRLQIRQPSSVKDPEADESIEESPRWKCL